jgi:retron-type reverse transcriptase
VVHFNNGGFIVKTYKNLYSKICAFENVHLAYLKARRDKRYKAEVLAFSANLEENLINIHNHLIWKSYRPSPYRYFTIYEPKERLIAALPFVDRVVHHALCNIIEPICERSMIYDSYACRQRRGVLAGVLRTTQFLRDAHRRWGKVYCLKADVRKFFPSIDHEVLKKIIRRHIACPDTLGMIETIIDSTGDNVGLPIGSLTSQLWANVYLNELDHFIKERLRQQYYIRYMDDFIILNDDKPTLQRTLKDITAFLDENLHLTLNAKTQIFPSGSRSVDFLGYRIWPDHRLLRKVNVRRTKRKLHKFERLYAEGQIGLNDIHPSVMSWMGHAMHADSYRLRKKFLPTLIFSRNNKESIIEQKRRSLTA